MNDSSINENWKKDLVSRILELLDELKGDLASEKNVHQLRTSVRRLEVALENTIPIRGMHKLQRELTDLRQHAGRVRDIDVQCHLLDSLGGNFERDVQGLFVYFKDRRSRYEQRLLKVADKVLADGFKKRLLRLAESSVIPTSIKGAEKVANIRDEYIGISAHVPLDGEPLHDFRKECKKLRYRLESIPGRESRTLAQDLKHVQDSIGLWHDWLELSSAAEKGLKRRSLPFRALLRSKITASRHDAVRSARELRDQLSSQTSHRKSLSKASSNRRLAVRLATAG